MKTCKSCPRPAMPNCSQCVDCHVKRLWGADYDEMVGRHIAEADRLPFDTPVHDEDYASEAMYQVDEMGRAG